jgi:hypothetical protein
MDIYCGRCGEPWDIESLHEESDYRRSEGEPVTVARVRADFAARGCVAFSFATDTECELDTGNVRAMASGALMDLLGDDIDGVAALLDDAEALGMFR